MTTFRFVKAIEQSGITLSEEAKKLLASIESEEDSRKKIEALRAGVKDAVANMLREYNFERLPGKGLTVTQAEDGEIAVAIISEKVKRNPGNGNGHAFGGGAGTKVKGPFVDTETGIEYANYHAVTVALLGHVCKAGFESESGTSKCGYWTKELVELRDGKRIVPKASYVPPVPATEESAVEAEDEVVAEVPAVEEEVFEDIVEDIATEEVATESPAPATVAQTQPEGNTGKKKHHKKGRR